MGEGADTQRNSSDRGNATDEKKVSAVDDEKTPAAGVPVGPTSLAPSQESRGRSSASYASASPHEIPEASKVAVHLDEPAVVVAADTECETLGRVDDELTNPRGSLNAVAVAVPVAEDGSDGSEGVTPVPAPPFPGPRVAGPSLRLRTPTVVITRPAKSGATWVAKAGVFGAMLLGVTAIGGFMITRADATSREREEEVAAPPPVRVVAVTPPPDIQTAAAVVAPSPAPSVASPAAAQDAAAPAPHVAASASAAPKAVAKPAPRAASSE